MTLDDIQTNVHTLYEGDIDAPSSGDDDYTLRTRLANIAINRWENEDGMLWNELRVKLSDAADGDTSTTSGTTVYDAPSDFMYPGGYVRLVDSDGNSTYYSVIPYEKLQLYDNEDKNICSFKGNESDGYYLEFLDDPEGTYTIKYEYYKTADSLSAITDTPEMSDPDFIVFFVASRLFEADGRITNARQYFQEAEARLSQMRTRNMQNAWYQDSRVEDWSLDQGIGGFGV